MNEANQIHEPQDNFTAALLHALETSPDVSVPSDFTARMMARLPQHPKPRSRYSDAVITTPGYGRKALIGAVALLVVLLAISATFPASNASRIFQFVLLGQACVYALWLCFGSRYLRS